MPWLGTNAPFATQTAAMRKIIRTKITARLLRLLPHRALRRFARQQDGSAAIEFGLVAVPFLALTFAIIESALVFFAGQTLEAAAAASARYSATTFKTAVCNQIFGLFDCANGVYVDVKSYANFAAISTSQPIANGKLDTSNMTYSPGGPGSIVVVSLYYQWPIYVSLLSNNLQNLTGNYHLLAATNVFRNEPYQ
jgi:Flp pilus assembly protein TadG